MSVRRIILVAVIATVLVMILIPLAILASGAIDMSATRAPGFLERTLAGWALERSTEMRAPEIKNPLAATPAVLEGGLSHYRENCVICHGAPGVEPAELAKGLNPPAPEFDDEEIAEESDGELFWIVKHGVRMTGMPAFGPTHSDDEIWRIVAFVRHLPELTETERSSLREATAEEHEHHHDGGDESPAATQPAVPETHPAHEH